jgi:AraC-like DNA-binding protein
MDAMSLLLSTIDPVSAGAVVYPPGGALGPRIQRDIELVLVPTGSAAIEVDGRPRALLRAGTAGLLLPGHRERFAFAADEPTRHSWVQARPAGPVPARLEALPPALPLSEPLDALVRAAVAAASEPHASVPELLAALATAAVWRYAGDAERGLRAGGAVDRADAYIRAHLGEPLDLARIAAAAHVSGAHLVRRFRAERGITPIAHLWELRVAAGIELLTNTGLSVNEIAARTGFRTVYHFSRRVRRATGRPPTAIRHADWQI